MVNLKINGRDVSVKEGTTILDAAKSIGETIPTLCYLKDINEIGACRVCVVEVEGTERCVTACNNFVEEGMVVYTNSRKVRTTRKTNVKLILSQHDYKCGTCIRSGNCTLQSLANELNISEMPYDSILEKDNWDKTFPLIRDARKCIKCMRCVQVCDNIQGMHVWDVVNTGSRTTVNVRGNHKIHETACTLCGQCVSSCPVGALTERDDVGIVLDAVENEDIITVVQVAPAVRTAWGESFGLSKDFATAQRLVAGLRRIGFDYIFDTTFAADMTIMEEANEFIDRVKNGGKLPIITSCSPGWVKFCEHYFPSLTENLSTCKSPQQMTGALIKTWFAEREGIDPNNIVSVSVMPCVAKKFEINRDDEDAAGVPDVDISITTRELARMIKMAQLNFARLPEEDFDPVMGVSTGAATIFGATGGVLEAALRTAADVLEGVDHDNIEYKEIRGTKGFKEAVYKVAGMDVKVAVVSGLNNANELLKKIESGEADYHIVEVMCCPGGCVNGGGQPIQPSTVRSFTDIKALRAKALYDEDAAKTLRKSHLNPVVKECYEWMGGEPGCHKAHELLHTSYVKRDRF